MQIRALAAAGRGFAQETGNFAKRNGHAFTEIAHDLRDGATRGDWVSEIIVAKVLIPALKFWNKVTAKNAATKKSAIRVFFG